MGRRFVTFTLAWTLAVVAIIPRVATGQQVRPSVPWLAPYPPLPAPPPSPYGAQTAPGNPLAQRTSPATSAAITTVPPIILVQGAEPPAPDPTPDNARPSPVIPVQSGAAADQSEPPAAAPDPAPNNIRSVPVIPVQTGPPPVQLQQPPIAAPPNGVPAPGRAPATQEPPLFETPFIPLPSVDARQIKFSRRTSSPFSIKWTNVKDGQVIWIIGGVKILARMEDKSNTVVDIEADNAIVWRTDGPAEDNPDSTDPNSVTIKNDRHTEVYLTGNVVIRYGSSGMLMAGSIPLEDRILRAERVYLDVSKNKAIAIKADMEMFRPGQLAVPAHVESDEIRQLSANEFEAQDARLAASQLPAGPGFDFWIRHLTVVDQKDQVERTIFGFPVVDRFTGEEVIGNNRRFYARNTFLDMGGVPVFYIPYLAGDPNDPTGPLQSFFYRQDQIFGSQVLSTWSILELIGVRKLPGERFDLLLDYLSLRGPAIGSIYQLSGPRLFGFDAPFTTSMLAYGIYDKGYDKLGGTRSMNWSPPGFRDRFQWRHVQDYDDFQFQGMVNYLSDPNFLEQYYKYEFDMGPNAETTGFLKYAHSNYAADLWVEPNFHRDWVTEAQWLPRADGFLLGESFFDRFTYNTWGSAGYANLQVYDLPQNQLPGNVNPATLVTNEQPLNTGRLDWMNQLSMPFSLGAFKVVPYVVGDLAYYSTDESGSSTGRVYGGFGTRASLPLTKRYEDVQSDLFNVNGITHKVALVANYYDASNNVSYKQLPQLDRLNDDATQEAVRDITPWQQVFVPGPNGNALFNSPLYNPQAYAVRRLVDSRADTLGTMQVLQTEVRQRWQTSRGYPGLEHTVDYVTLDLSASYFPAYNRDNFGHPISFLEYNASWAIGDNNGLTSSGWLDPYAFGTRYWNATAYFNRPDRTSFLLSYRYFDPVGSRQLSGSVTYAFSPKYAMTFSSAYDFGLSANQSTSLILTRVGSDLTWMLGFSYNAIINNFSFNFMIVPNLLGGASSAGGFGNQAMGRR